MWRWRANALVREALEALEALPPLEINP